MASDEKLEPTMRIAVAPGPVRSTSRRATNALKITSESAGLVLMSRRKSLRGTRISRPPRLTRAVRYARVDR